VALCQARISTKPLWGFSSSNPYHSQSRAEHILYGHLHRSSKAGDKSLRRPKTVEIKVF
jgi:hypothetical protein